MTRVACLLLVMTCSGVAFAGQGAVSPGTSATIDAKPAVVATVNGAAITSDRLSAALAALVPQESFHRTVGEERLAALRRSALERLVEEELAYQDGVRRGIRPSTAERRAAWNNTVARYGGPAGFAAALRRSGMRRAELEHEIARRLIGDKNYERAVVSRCAVNRDAAQQFFDSNPERFVEPEQLHVFAITVGVDPSGGQVEWDAAKERAAQARHALQTGLTFAQAAREYSTDSSRDAGGDMGYVHRGSLAPPFEALAADLPLGQPSDVVQTLYGYHIVLVSEVRPAAPRAFDEVSRSLIAELTEKQCAEQKQSWLSGLRAAASIQMMEPIQ